MIAKALRCKAYDKSGVWNLAVLAEAAESFAKAGAGFSNG